MGIERFPVFLDITDWNICFVGGGKVAERRIKTLLFYSCHIFVISPEVTDELSKMAQKKLLVWLRNEVSDGDEKAQIEEYFDRIRKCCKDNLLPQKNMSMVLACTDKREINHRIYEYCREQKILVNTADCKEECDFYFPGIVPCGDVIVGVSGNGKNHRAVKRIINKLRDLYGK